MMAWRLDREQPKDSPVGSVRAAKTPTGYGLVIHNSDGCVRKVAVANAVVWQRECSMEC